MSFFVWDPKLLLGVDAMDTEHRALVVRMNEIHDKVEAGASKAVLSTLLQGLADLTRRHFDHEEKMMQAAAYSGFETHKLVHKDLLTKLDGHVADFKAGPGTLGPGFFSFLRLWLTAHILGIDQKYAPAVRERRVA
jgi:hemerythrin